MDEILKPVEITPPKPQKIPDEQLAAEYFRNKEYGKAAEFYGKLFEKSRSTVYYSYYLYCLVELEDFREAEKTVKKQIRNRPGDLKYLVDLGYVYAAQGDMKKARKQYEEALDNLRPNKANVLELANAFLLRGETDFAIETYQRGSKIMSGYPFNLELGNLYAQLGNRNRMITEYLDYIAYDPFNVQPVQNRLQNEIERDESGEITGLLRKHLLVRIQDQPEQTIYSEMLLWLAIQQKDFDLALIQAKSLDRRNNETGRRVHELGELALANESYDVAYEAFSHVMKKGRNSRLYLPANIGLLNTQYLKITNTSDYSVSDLEALEKDYKKTLDDFGRIPLTLSIMKYLAHLQAFYLDKSDEAIALLNEAIDMPSASEMSVAECKTELADILLFTGDVWEATLLYSQVEKAFKHEPIGHEAKFKNARLSFYIGEFNWAKAQLDVLKAATSKLIANDALELSLLISDNIDYDSSTAALAAFARADLLSFRNNNDMALATLDSLLNQFEWHPILDETLFKKAQILAERGDFDEAKVQLEKILELYPNDIKADNALFMLAGLYDRQYQDREKAGALYLRLIKEYPASVFVTQSRERFRTLRGDRLGPEEELIENIP